MAEAARSAPMPRLACPFPSAPNAPRFRFRAGRRRAERFITTVPQSNGHKTRGALDQSERVMVRAKWPVALVLASLSSTVLAQTGVDGQAARNACRDDAQKLCASVQRGGGAIVNCLTNQKEKL